MGGAKQASRIMHLNIFHAQHGGIDHNRDAIAETRLDTVANQVFAVGRGAMDDNFLDGAEKKGLHAVHRQALLLFKPLIF